LSHNIANTNTTGYKRREATFSDLLFQQVNNQSNPNIEVGRLTPNGIRVGAGAKIAQTALRTELGPLMETDRELDFAITEKDHFFRIQTLENGNPVERFTRDGAFYLSEDPNNDQLITIVTKNGDFVLDEAGNRINLPLNFQAINLSRNGQLVATLKDGTEQNIGQFSLTRILKPQLLDSVGDNLYRLPDIEGLGFALNEVIQDVPTNEGLISQRFLEGSNVDLSREMNELIETQRHYQFNARSISMADEMSGLINGLRR
jgi:flagellar basal-body rod protein FlgG